MDSVLKAPSRPFLSFLEECGRWTKGGMAIKALMVPYKKADGSETIEERQVRIRACWMGAEEKEVK